MNPIRFTKMHGLENDYIFLDAFAQPELVEQPLTPDNVIAICNRRTGPGADGVILLFRAEDPRAQAAMRIINADGAEAEMCGNGARCAVKLLIERQHVETNDFLLQTASGLLEVALDAQSDLVTINMGPPALALEAIPVDASALDARPEQLPSGAWRITVGPYPGVPVSTGNPHFVIPWPEPLAHVRLVDFAPSIQLAPVFPQRANVHILHPTAHDAAQLRSYERGVGETRACGTGACAALVAGASLGMLGRSAVFSMPGGDLRIDWSEADACIRQTGPAEYAFAGLWPL